MNVILYCYHTDVPRFEFLAPVLYCFEGKVCESFLLCVLVGLIVPFAPREFVNVV